MKLKFPRIRLPSGTAAATLLDLACLAAGFFLLARGLWLIYPPSALVVCGILLIACGLWPPGRSGE